MRGFFCKTRTTALLCLFVTGCTTNYYIDQSTPHQKPLNTQKETVFVTNKNHKDFELLKKSEIYNLSEDPTKAAPLTLTKPSYEMSLYCGVGTLMTFGLIPEKCPYEEKLSYSIGQGNTVRHYEHNITYYSRTSLWEALLIPFRNSREKIRVKALAISKRQE